MNARDCYETEGAGQAFLRFITTREQRALPYALIVDMELSEDAAVLKLFFPHYEITVHGRQLRAIFNRIASTRCTAIRLAASSAASGYETSDDTPTVTRIHLKRIAAATQN